MAYSYDFFSKQLIGNDKIQLSEVFPQVQTDARQALNLTYGLGDIVLYLQDVTQDFTRAERQYIDLDNAIQSIVFKYYNSKGEKNPFKSNTTGVVQMEQGPREAIVVDAKEGKTKGKGKAKNLFKKDEEVVKDEVVPVPASAIEPVVVPATPEVFVTDSSATGFDQAQEEATLKDMITEMEKEGLADDPDVIAGIADQVMATFGYGQEEQARKWFEQNGFDYDKYNQ